VIVERGFAPFGGLEKFVFTVLLVCASSYQDKSREFFPGRSKMVNNFLLPTEGRFINLPHPRPVGAINLNFTDL
jgi:hypothetical protein